jgi:hypothetical protein
MGTRPQGCAIEVNLEEVRVLLTVRSTKIATPRLAGYEARTWHMRRQTLERRTTRFHSLRVIIF